MVARNWGLSVLCRSDLCLTPAVPTRFNPICTLRIAYLNDSMLESQRCAAQADE